jgi:hypothetical protein
MTEQTRDAVDEAEPSWPERSAAGAAWRGAVVLVLSLVALPVGAWFTTKISEPELAGIALSVLALVVVGLVVGWLRARDVFVILALYGSLTGSLACAYLLGKGYVSPHRPYVADASWARFAAAVTAVGFATVVVAVVWGTVSGYRRPRPYKPKQVAVSQQRSGE